jgi:adenine-specific DNA-methyltransferase
MLKGSAAPIGRVALGQRASTLSRKFGTAAAKLSIEDACYQVCTTYTSLVPLETRGKLGMYYTPPALTSRLLQLVEEAGICWDRTTVLDPACGGGAFLLPVALRMRRALQGHSPKKILESIAGRLAGFEIDPFAAWLTRAWLQIGLADLLIKCRKELPPIVRTCNAFEQSPVPGDLYDLVVGNPPYGRVSLSKSEREKFARSLYGHANCYGIFTDAALRWTKPGGVIAFVTPTSFLAGEYFKKLRFLLATEAPPVAIDIIGARSGVFEDVLQETMLAVYRRAGAISAAGVNRLTATSTSECNAIPIGELAIPSRAEDPWMLPRSAEHRMLIARLRNIAYRLRDWGYTASTGPLVWNRHKPQFRATRSDESFPVVWAEAVSISGHFVWRARKRNHQPFIQLRNRDKWLKVTAPCVLVQRTTAKEQARRLIAAEMDQSFIRTHGAAVVENHLNMVRPSGEFAPRVSTAALAAFLNSAVADQAFRCMNGSVAVSAFELEALPVPAPARMAELDEILSSGASQEAVDAFISALYFDEAQA